MSASTSPGLPPHVVRALSSVPPDRWHLLALLADEEHGERILTRGELAAHLRANDLGHLAHEAIMRRVRTGDLLALVVSEAHGARFHVLRVGRSTR